jgi:hypothetical protein
MEGRETVMDQAAMAAQAWESVQATRIHGHACSYPLVNEFSRLEGAYLWIHREVTS